MTTSTDVPLRSPGAVGFGSAQRMLSLFAQGLAGRPLHLQPQTMQALETTIGRSGRLASGGITLTLPDEIADFDDARDNLGAYRIAVLHQLGIVQDGATAFDFRIAAGRLGLAEPSFGWRPEPPTELERFYATVPRPAMLRRLFALVEDLRIDSALPRRYPGARGDLQRAWAHALCARPDTGGLRPLALAFEVLLRGTIGAPRESLPADERVDAMLLAIAPVEAPGASVYDSAAAAIAVYALLESMARRPLTITSIASDVGAPDGIEAGAAASTGGDTDGADRLIDDDFDGPGVAFRGNGLQGISPRRRPGGAAAVKGDLPADAQRVEGRPRAPGEEASAPPAAPPRPARSAARLQPDGLRSFFYDEWDCHQQRYLKAWCRVHEQRLRGSNVDFIHDVKRRHALLARQIKRGFAFLRPEEWQRVHRTDDGDELELDAVIDAVIDRRRGHANEGGLYVRRDRARREVAAVFLMDMSASTDFAVPDPSAAIPLPSSTIDDDDVPVFYAAPVDRQPPPTAPKRRVIDVAKDALALMVDALQALGDACAVYGFSGDGRERVELLVAKEFTDPTDARTAAALAAMEPRGSTRMGPAVRHAAAKLARHGARSKVLIVVSDGYPQDRDYGPDWRDTGYGIEDTARALREAEAAGIATFCITIDPAGHDYLRRMCAEHRYLVIADVHTLPAELGKVYRGLTVSR